MPVAGNYAVHSAPNDLRVEAALFYFVGVSMAKAFVERFACGLAVLSHPRLAEG